MNARRVIYGVFTEPSGDIALMEVSESTIIFVNYCTFFEHDEQVVKHYFVSRSKELKEPLLALTVSTNPFDFADLNYLRNNLD